jgi:hypothetical protein
MNNLQRTGAFVTVALAVVVVVLHSPWEGYTTTSYGSLGGYNFDTPLSFLEWRTNAPVVFWFGSVLHLLVALFAVGLLSAAWHYIFRSSPVVKNERSRSSEQT